MSKLDTGGKSHHEAYPMPAWMKQWLGIGVHRVHRTLTAEDFPLHNYPVIMRHAVDGDTMEVDTVLRTGERNGLGRVVVTERIRLLGYNSPELNEDGGYDAKRALDELIPTGTMVYVHTYHDRRSFNRLLAWGYVDGEGVQLLDVSRAMIASGNGTPA